MLKKKPNRQWIDGNMFWYTYGTTQKEECQERDEEQEDADDETNSQVRKDNSNGELRAKKVTFVGKVEHEYDDDEDGGRNKNGILGMSVGLLNKAKNKVSDKLANYYHDKVPFYADSIKERFEEFLDSLPFGQRDNATTEIINTDTQTQATVLRSQDVDPQESDNNISILVAISEKVPVKKKQSFFSIISESIFAKKEEKTLKNPEGMNKRMVEKTNSTSNTFESCDSLKKELNNHNSLNNDVIKFFVFEPLDLKELQERPSIVEKCSFWKKLKTQQHNVNNSNKIIVFRKSKVSNMNKTSSAGHKSYKVTHYRNEKKTIMKDPCLPKKKMDASKKVEQWMSRQESQTCMEMILVDSYDNEEIAEGMSELMKRSKVEGSSKLQLPSFCRLSSNVNVKTHIKVPEKELETRSKATTEQTWNLTSRKVSCNTIQSVKLANNTLPCKGMLESHCVRKAIKQRSSSAKNMLRNFMKKALKLKSLSSVTKKIDGHCGTTHNAVPPASVLSSSNNTSQDRAGAVYTYLRQTRMHKNTLARNDFFGISVQEGNISSNNHASAHANDFFQCSGSPQMNANNNIPENRNVLGGTLSTKYNLFASANKQANNMFSNYQLPNRQHHFETFFSKQLGELQQSKNQQLHIFALHLQQLEFKRQQLQQQQHQQQHQQQKHKKNSSDTHCSLNNKNLTTARQKIDINVICNTSNGQQPTNGTTTTSVRYTNNRGSSTNKATRFTRYVLDPTQSKKIALPSQ